MEFASWFVSGFLVGILSAAFVFRAITGAICDRVRVMAEEVRARTIEVERETAKKLAEIERLQHLRGTASAVE
jgi:hypothetical protein